MPSIRISTLRNAVSNTPGTSGVAFLAFLVCIPALHAQPQPQGKTLLDGVYSEAQATRGKGAYTTACSRCHGNALEGISAPTLTGDHFLERWREDTLDSFYTFIKDNMPPRISGNVHLPDNGYLDVVTYILKMNGYRSGAGNLAPESLEGILVVGKNGAQPVPDGALVATVGCLSQVRADAWRLDRAAEPGRTRNENIVLPDDLNSASRKSLGTLTFRLTDFEAIPKFKPEAHKGQKVLAKGYLVRQPNAERIGLSAMEVLAATCGP